MNRIRFFSVFILLLYGISMCPVHGEEVVNLQHIGNHDDHSQYYTPADMPEVYLDLDDMEIIIEADGFADYYVVNIISQVSMQSVIYTQIGGYGDSINISSLPDAYYRIVIQSSNNNVYEGYFLWEQE